MVGHNNGETERLIRDAFGIDINSEIMKKKRRMGREKNQKEIIQQLSHKITLKWLFKHSTMLLVIISHL
jgi:hypothetical protein